MSLRDYHKGDRYSTFCILRFTYLTWSNLRKLNLPAFQYDDRPAGLLSYPIENPYLGLNYKAWNLPTNATAAVPVSVGGLEIHSLPNQLLTARDIQLLAGTPSFTVVPPYKDFIPLDFWFGCVARTMQGAVELATNCTVTITGYAAKTGQKVAVTNFTFTPPLDPIGKVPMIHVVLPESFHVPLLKVTMIQTGVINSLWIDDMAYNIIK